MDTKKPLTLDEKNQRLVKRLVFITFAMFLFGFALVPIYNVLCKVAGLNGKTDPAQYGEFANNVEDTSRLVTVEFTTTMNEGLPWEFHPMHKRVEMHPGSSINTAYFAKNLSNATMTIQAIPSVSPGLAAKYIKKLECFCFTKQSLKAGESAEMGLKFILDADLPKEVHTITLSYTLFDLTDK